MNHYKMFKQQEITFTSIFIAFIKQSLSTLISDLLCIGGIRESKISTTKDAYSSGITKSTAISCNKEKTNDT